ncbi:outer membrane protein transport protein [Amaricoccus sp.]|uniref:OmpP1/FadL family transporter n=1 Tax=Amaricoccus sp. TaxID=1872485 RepID=UPI001B5A1E5D|nr:outer membrane protein transport protein [Amaricoccus sp.]MBP7240748.1 outer membrane protein transport protein [Amaricoccus sp.]
MSAVSVRNGAVFLACACTIPGAAFAAALERAVPALVRILYEDGTYGEIGAVYTHPELEGKNGQLPPSLGGFPVSGNTGNLLRSDWKFGGALKGDINEQLSWILVLDQPYVANTYYSHGSFPAAFNYGGTDADLDTWQAAAGLAYDATDRIKIYGGVRAQRLEASAAIPFLAGYEIDADAEWGWGGFVGAAYARPEIGLRVELTYQSKISYDLSTTEQSNLGRLRDTTDVDTPQSVTLEAQTGINEKTLAFGSVRWVQWSEFAIAPTMYGDITELALQERRALVDYTDDWWTYSIGVARQLRDDLAGTFSVTYEPQVNEVMTTLGPVDGRTMLGVGLSYDVGKVNLAGGVSYGWLGDATNLLDTKYRDGTILALGFRVGYSF